MSVEPKIIGIDLGTTNSVVAVVEGDEPIVIPNQEGANKTPSVVAFLDNNECIVGEIARRQAATNAKGTITSIKRLIGLEFEDLDDIADIFPYDIINHDDHLLIDINGLGYTPEQISSLILKKLKESAEAFLSQPVSQAVITVPAHFNDSQRQATLRAADLAGLEVLRLINEPTAAALAYGVGKSTDSDETLAVFDFGGGTFDITILEISEKTFDVLTSSGDNRLGGDDLDNLVVNLLVEEFYKQHAVDLTTEPVTLRRLKEVAEKAKCELSSAMQAQITLPFIAYRDGTPLHLERIISRDEFEELIEPFINKTIRCCKRALEEAGINKRDIKKVILVGGSTRIPLVQDAVEDFFGLAPFKGINPDEVVALGAATQAGVFAGNIEEVTLLDVVPHSLGIEVKDGKFSKLIERNEKIPVKASKHFTTTEDDQTFVNIHVLQGESSESSENRSLGKFTLADIPPAPKGRPRVQVGFFVNADGVMEISAEELGSGIAKSLTIVHSELDEAEKRVRRKARQRKKSASQGGFGDKSGTKRYAIPGSGTGVRPRNGAKASDSSSGGALAESPAASAVPKPVSRPTEPMVNQPTTIDEAPEGAPRSTVPPQAYGTPQRYTRGPAAATRIDSKEGPVTTPESQTGSGGPTSPQPVPAGDFDSSATQIQHHVTDPATDAFGKSEEKFPPDIEAAFDFARAGQETKEAQRVYANALSLFTRSPLSSDESYGALIRLASIQMMMGQQEEMISTLGTLSRQHGVDHREPIADLLDRAIQRFAASGGLRRVRSVFRELIGNFDGASEDLEFASKVEPRDNDMEKLERLYKLRAERGNDPSAQFKLVKIFLKTNRVDDAIELLQQLQTNKSYETRAVKILGLCHWQKNLHYLAWQKFRALEQTEEIRDILYRLANDMESTNQLSNALTVYEHIADNSGEYRDVAARIKKLQYRIKLNADEDQQSGANQILDDPRFLIIEEINRGSMGIIFKAKDKTLEEVVALKVLNDYLCSDPGAIERFKREARAAKRLSHPYIVRIHDMYENGSKRFISMEYIEGTDLKRLLSERASFGEDQLIYYFMQICDALSYAHNMGIIHRDIKPANIMITKDNNVKVTDFGIAKVLKGDDSTKGGTAVIGTPLYMSPEQITGEGVDARSDIYALGIMMYELVSGNPPFYLGNIEYHHIHTAAPPLPDKVSPMLREIIMRCVEKSPANRFQTIDELYDALQAVSSKA